MNIYLNLTNKDYLAIKKLENGNANDKRYAEILKLVIIDKDFQDIVQKVRQILGLPENGLDLKDAEQKKLFLKYLTPLEIKRDIFYPESFNLGKDARMELVSFFESKNWYGANEKYYNDDWHSVSLIGPISSYVLAGYFDLRGSEMISVIIPEYNGDPEITLQVSPFVTKEEMIDFIQRNWEGFAFIKNDIIGEISSKRNKIKKNFFRDVYITSLFKKAQQKKKSYPELEVVKILKEKDNIHISEGTVRTIASRINKLVSNKQG